MSTINNSIKSLQQQLAAAVSEMANNPHLDAPSSQVVKIMKKLELARRTRAELTGRTLGDDVLDRAAEADADEAAASFARNACEGKPERFDSLYVEARARLSKAVRRASNDRLSEPHEQFQKQADEFRATMSNTCDALTSAYREGLQDGRSGRHTSPPDKRFGAPIGSPFLGIKV